MSRYLSVLLVACFYAASCDGAIFSRDWLSPGDNLITLDSITGREWLDLTETVLPSVDGGDPAERLAAFQSRLVEGGDLFGFQVATTADVIELAVSAGIDPNTSDITVNGAPAAKLATFTSSAGVLIDLEENVRVTSLTENPELRSVRISYVTKARFRPEALITERTALSSSSVWVFRRAVPETSTLAMFIGFFPALSLRKRGVTNSNPPGGRHAPSTEAAKHSSSHSSV